MPKPSPQLDITDGWSWVEPSEPGFFHKAFKKPWRDDFETQVVTVELIEGVLSITHILDYYGRLDVIEPLWDFDDQCQIQCLWRKASKNSIPFDDTQLKLGPGAEAFEKYQRPCFTCGKDAIYFQLRGSEDRWAVCRNAQCSVHSGSWTPEGYFQTFLQSLKSAIAAAGD